MAHYNLYESLGLDRAKPSEELAAEISRRLNDGDTGNPGGADELQVALDIFSEPSRRARYDAILDDPSQPELRIGGLRQIATEAGGPAAEDPQGPSQDPQMGQQPASGQFQQFGQPQPGQQFGQPQPGQPGQQFGQPQPGQPQQSQQSGFSGQAATAAAGAKKAFADAGEKLSGASENLKGEYAKSSRKAIIVTAVVTAVACLLAFGLFSWITGGSGGDKPVKMAKEFVKKDTDRDRVDWINEHFDASFTEKLTDNEYDAEELNDYYTDFVGVGSADVLEDVDYGAYREVTMTVDDQPFFETAESEAGITEVHRVSVGDKDSGVPKAYLTFLKRDGDWYFANVNKVREADALSGRID
ncbi:hypothetical protein [Corynebacterium frankenforstense]|uniref:hypothetical protein n=1 Tax=Corynebacterium frankenforstense TaxID=1230998 RepID=UPI000952F55A|nr:hypothetical protein [Corynebacterium frankenforstense]